VYEPCKALITLCAFADCDETLMWLLMRLLLESGVETFKLRCMVLQVSGVYLLIRFDAKVLQRSIIINQLCASIAQTKITPHMFPVTYTTSVHELKTFEDHQFIAKTSSS
jgi:hypothetical protein